MTEENNFVVAELSGQKEGIEAELHSADPPSVHQERTQDLLASIRAAQQDLERLKKENR